MRVPRRFVQKSPLMRLPAALVPVACFSTGAVGNSLPAGGLSAIRTRAGGLPHEQAKIAPATSGRTQRF